MDEAAMGVTSIIARHMADASDLHVGSLLELQPVPATRTGMARNVLTMRVAEWTVRLKRVVIAVSAFRPVMALAIRVHAMQVGVASTVTWIAHTREVVLLTLLQGPRTLSTAAFTCVGDPIAFSTANLVD